MLRGKPIVEFFPRLFQLHPQIKTLTFATYKPGPKLSERLSSQLSKQEEALRDKAEAICKENGIPFWDAVLGISMKDNAIPERFVDAALAHEPTSPAKEFALENKEVTVDRIHRIIDELPEGCGLAVSSRLQLVTGDISHLPMADFRCQCGEGNARAIRKMLEHIGQPEGMLIQSGRSYHFYGFSLLSPDAWTKFMGQVLLFAPVTDPRYVAHRLIDGQCRLKIVGSKNEPPPPIVDIFPTLV